MGKLLDQKEAAERLGMSPRTLSNWRYRREGPPSIKVGRSVRYDEDALRAWVEGLGTTPSEGDDGPLPAETAHSGPSSPSAAVA